MLLSESKMTDTPAHGGGEGGGGEGGGGEDGGGEGGGGVGGGGEGGSGKGDVEGVAGQPHANHQVLPSVAVLPLSRLKKNVEVDL